MELRLVCFGALAGAVHVSRPRIFALEVDFDLNRRTRHESRIAVAFQ